MRWDLCVPHGLWLQFANCARLISACRDVRSIACQGMLAKRTERLYLKQCPLTGLSFCYVVVYTAERTCIASCRHVWPETAYSCCNFKWAETLEETCSRQMPWQSGSQYRSGKAARACSCALMRMLCSRCQHIPAQFNGRSRCQWHWQGRRLYTASIWLLVRATA